MTELTSGPGETRPGLSPPPRLAVGAASWDGPVEGALVATPCEGDPGNGCLANPAGAQSRKAPRASAPGGPNLLSERDGAKVNERGERERSGEGGEGQWCPRVTAGSHRGRRPGGAFSQALRRGCSGCGGGTGAADEKSRLPSVMH